MTVYGNDEGWDWRTARVHVFIQQGPNGDSKLPTLEELPAGVTSLETPHPPEPPSRHLETEQVDSSPRKESAGKAVAPTPATAVRAMRAVLRPGRHRGDSPMTPRRLPRARQGRGRHSACRHPGWVDCAIIPGWRSPATSLPIATTS